MVPEAVGSKPIIRPKIIMKLDFWKMEGLGNSFVVCQGPLKITSETIRNHCDKTTGENVDGFIVVTPIDNSMVRMQYWNSDGSSAEICGNGLRCVARFAYERHLITNDNFVIETDVGPRKGFWNGKDPNNIEVQVGKVSLADQPLRLYGQDFYIAEVGNPHAVTFVKDVSSAPVQELGPKIETDPKFPHKTNVEFVKILSTSSIRMRVWERGVGETQACGTGMVAATEISRVLNKIKLPAIVEVPGGKAKINIDEEGYYRIIGPANIIKKQIKN